MKQIILTLILWTGFCLIGKSQVLPPDFDCINSDTLNWNNVPNNCGPFIGYDIFFSSTEEGPYSLLASVTDENQDFFHHSTSGGALWYYYIVPNYDCPGEPVISSDTLQNGALEIVDIQSVDVQGDDVLISWYPGASAQTAGYIIFRREAIGFVAIDTIFGSTNYLDVDVDINNQTEEYLVNAIDNCFNSSVFSDPHQSIFVETSVDSCTQSVILEWNPYANWLNGVQEYQVFASIGSNPASFFAAGSAGTSTSFVFDQAFSDTTYCFFVRAVENQTGIFANSNIACQLVDVVVPVQELFIKNVSVTPTNEVIVTAVVNDDAEITSFDLFNSDDNSLITSTPAVFPLFSENTFLDNISNPDTGAISYILQTTDICGTNVNSNTGQSIHITATPIGPTSNQVNWTPIGIDNVSNVSYEVYRVENGVEILIGTTNSNTTNILDPVDIEEVEDAEKCYVVIADATVSLPSGQQDFIRSRSNVGCVQQPVRIFVPNAFAPRGVNQVFRPLISFGDELTYQMTIYNRYGEELFRSNEIETGWNGRYKGRVLDAGAYLYVIEINSPTEGDIVRKGTVVLVR